MNLDLKTVFAENVKKYRKERRLTQEELAFESGLHRTYISSIERGRRNVSIENIEKIASALHKMPHQLLYYKSEEKE